MGAVTNAERLVAVAVGVTTPGNDPAVRELADALHAGVPGVPVLIGGGGLTGQEHAAALGADGWARDATAVLVLLDDLVADAV